MFTLNVYLNFDGNCEEAFTLYKSVFGGEFEMLSRMGEVPATEGFPELTDEQKNKIMHVAYPISNIKLFGSDIPENHEFVLNKGNNVSISIDCESKEEADRFFKGLSDGGIATMPIADTFWGAYFGMCTDKFGILWMLNFDYPKG
jgi:PhnB protein